MLTTRLYIVWERIYLPKSIPSLVDTGKCKVSYVERLLHKLKQYLPLQLPESSFPHHSNFKKDNEDGDGEGDDKF